MRVNPKFNSNVSLYKNIQARLMIESKEFEDVARELKTTAATLRTIIGNKFNRNGKSTPLDKKVFHYFYENIQGFKEYCKEHNINLIIVS